MDSGIIMGIFFDINAVKAFLLYSILINYVVAMIWFCVFFFAHDWMYKIHTKWFTFSTQAFDIMNYAGLGLYKIGIILFNIVPFISLYCLG